MCQWISRACHHGNSGGGGGLKLLPEVCCFQMTPQSRVAQYPPDKARFLRRATLHCDPSSLSISRDQEMRPDVNHDSSLTWDLLLARLMWAFTCDANKELLISRRDDPWVCLCLCAAFISSRYCDLFPPLVCQSPLPLLFCLCVLRSCFPSFALLLHLGSDDVKAKQSASLLQFAGSLALPKTLKCGLE